MKKILFLVGLSMITILHCHGQIHFRSGIFLHHSTGGCIWGPNGSNTSVPQEMTEYNVAHGYTGSLAVTMNEEWWAPGDNEWSTQHSFFEDPSPVTGIGYYLPGNKVIVIKTCFPASAMSGAGQPSDTLNPGMKTVYNYKWHWRHIVNVMNQHPENFFVIWTNAPLVAGATNTTEAALSRRFCIWAKDTLAMGLDPGFGTFPPNVYVFDFFRKLTGPNGMMLPMYAASSGDSHPNAAATVLVAPQFVQEIFDASITYELQTGLDQSAINVGRTFGFYPNPCRDETVLRYNSAADEEIFISFFDQSGKLICNISGLHPDVGVQDIPVSVKTLDVGTYYVRLKQGTNTSTTSLVVVR